MVLEVVNQGVTKMDDTVNGAVNKALCMAGQDNPELGRTVTTGIYVGALLLVGFGIAKMLEK